MIKLNHADDGGEIYSIPSQIEFLIFYDRIKYLVDFYNHSKGSYYNLLDQKKHENNQLIRAIENNALEIENISDEIYINSDEIVNVLNEELDSVRTHFLEFQKMTLLIVLYSEVEKLIDNLLNTFDVNTKNIKTLNQKIKKLAGTIELSNEDFISLQSVTDELRIIRNKLVHAYDYWDDVINLNGKILNGLEKLYDSYIENIIDRIIDSILKLEEEYNFIREKRRLESET